MAIVSVPVKFLSPDFTYQIDLDLVVYTLRFCLNERTGRYSMTISTEAGVEIIAGVAVVTNWVLLNRFKDARLPPGILFTCDMTGGTDEPNETNLGDTILLCYQEAS